jgi:hypothetical protein
MPVQIFVEDRLSDAYEILALRALGLPPRKDRQRVRASRVDLDDLTSRAGMLDLARRAWDSGYDCVLFILDEEGLPRSPDRPAKLRAFRPNWERCQAILLAAASTHSQNPHEHPRRMRRS